MNDKPHTTASTCRAVLRRLARCSLAVRAALLGLLACHLMAQSSSPPQWTRRVRAGDIVYFGFASPARLERYDLASEQWLTSISLPAAPTALAVDSQGIYYATDRTVYKAALDGTGAQPLYNAPVSVTGLLVDGTYLFVCEPGYAENRIDSLRESDGQFVATWNGIYSLTDGFSIAPTQHRIYGINTETTAFSTLELPYNTDGTFGTVKELWSNGNFSSGKTWVAPTERALVRDNGVVYSIPDLTERGGLAGSIDDAGFYGTDVLIALRGNTLVAFDQAYLESGRYTLGAAAKGIAVRGTQVYAFRPDASSSSGIAVEKAAISSLTAAQPGTALNPALLAFVPDDVLQAEDGTLLLFSKALQSIFRWSPTSRSYTASYPLLGTPSSIAYSPTLRRIFLAYTSGAITQIKLDTGTTEVPYVNLNTVPQSMVPMDELLFVNVGNTFDAGRVFDQDGAPKATGLGLYNVGYLWSSSLRRLYLLTAYGALGYAPVDTTGAIGASVYPPGYAAQQPQLPLRLAGDSSAVAGGNGYVFKASDVSYLGTLSNAVTDLTWRSGAWASIRAAGADTQLQTWNASLFADRALTVPGYPLRIFGLADGKAAILTTSGGTNSYSYGTPANSGNLIFSIYDPAGDGSITSSPRITANPVDVTVFRGANGSLSVTASASSPTYQWRRNGADLAGATNATYTITSAADADAGSYVVVITDAYGSTASIPVTVTVQPPPPAPTISAQPQNTYAIVGGTASLSISASGTMLSYQWRKAGTDISGATGYSLSFTNIAAGDFASYDVVVSNAGGSVTSTTAQLQPATAPALTTQPTDETVTAGTTVTFSVAASGTPAPYFNWQRKPAGSSTFSYIYDGTMYAGTGTATLTIASATLAMNGDQFRCVVVNGFGPNAVSAAATLGVNTAPKITSAASTTFIVGVPSSFVVRALGTPAPTFNATGLPNWAALDATSGVISGTPPSTAAAPFTVSITATNGNAPDDHQTFTLNVQSTVGAPVITIDPVNRSTGVGGAASFSVAATGTEPLAYQWTKDGATIADATSSTYDVASAALTDAGRYRVIVTNSAGSATSQSAILSVIPDSVSATHAVVGSGYMPGQNVVITNTLNYTGTSAAIGWQVLLPDGWSYVSGGGAEGDVKPAAGTTGLLEWAWTSPLTAPVTFTYTVNVPATETNDRQISALVTLRTGASPMQFLALQDPLVIRRITLHAADTDQDSKISLFELTRVIELYNTRNGTTRTGCYKVDATGEDGFAVEPTRAGTAAATLTVYHSADENHDGKISLLELTRVIELYNYRSGTTRTGQYHVQLGTEDGFAPGP